VTFEEIFEPGLRHWREWREHQKMREVVTPAPGPGNEPFDIDLDAGTATLREGAATHSEDGNACRSDEDAPEAG
jgi:hypothetical protein